MHIKLGMEDYLILAGVINVLLLLQEKAEENHGGNETQS